LLGSEFDAREVWLELDKVRKQYHRTKDLTGLTSSRIKLREAK
jgi:hypothetical protein